MAEVTGFQDVCAAYGDLLAITDRLDDAAGWLPTGCAGWAVRDLVFHLNSDAQRALVALGTPADRSPDVDAVSYWHGWQPGTDGAERMQRTTRIMASAWTSVTSIAQLYGETARAVLVLAGRADPAAVVATQGHAITVDDLLSTLAIEATLHHLDLVAELVASGPSAANLALVRRTLDGLLGRPAPADWQTQRWALIGTGREVQTDDERATLGADANRLPLFG